MKNTPYLIVFIYCNFVLLGYAQGQDYSNLFFNSLNSLNGLNSDVVNSVHQDKNGFLWFSTSEGIVRYDGYEFQSYKNYPDIGKLYGLNINAIESDKNGGIYICSDYGFYAFNNLLEPIFENLTSMLNGVVVSDVHLGNDGYIYIATDQGFYILNANNTEIKSIVPKEGNGLTTAIIKQIEEDNEGRIWAGSWQGGLLKLNPDKKSFTAYKIFNDKSAAVYKNTVVSLMIDSHGYMWAGTWSSGIYVLDIGSPDEVRVIKRFNSVPDDSRTIPGDIIHSMIEDEYNGIWIGTPEGVAVIRYPLTKNSKIIRFQYSKLPGDILVNEIKNVYRDREGLIWLCTKGGGVYYTHIEANDIEHIEIPDIDSRVKKQAVHAIAIDHENCFLFGVSSLGFVSYNTLTSKFHSYKQLPKYQTIANYIDLNTARAFLWDRDSALWIGTRYNGILKLESRTGQVTFINSTVHSESFTGREVSCLYSEPDGTVWACTENGLHRIHQGDNNEIFIEQVNFAESNLGVLGPMNFTGIIKRNDNYIVGSKAAGLFLLSPHKGDFEIKRWNGDKDLKVNTVYMDSKGRVWVGTCGNGLMLLDSNDSLINPYDANITLLGDVIYAINEDNYGNIWLTSNKGLARLSYKEGDTSVKSFSYLNGLQGNVFIPRAFFKDSDGIFSIGCFNGVYRFDPLKITTNQHKPSVVITEVLVEGEKYPYVQGQRNAIKLTHLKNDLNVVFSSLSYLFPEGNHFAYKMEGIDKSWKYVEANMRSANYSNLSPGNYVFKVKGSNSMGVWNDTPVEISVEVVRAFYKTWWAIAFYIIFALSVLFVFYWQRLKSIRVKQMLDIREIEKTESEKLHQFKLQFFTNISHELLTPLSILLSVIERIEERKDYSAELFGMMKRNTLNLNRLIRQLLSFRKVETGHMKIQLETINLSEFVECCAGNFRILAEKRKMKLVVDVQKGLKGIMDREKLEIIIHNLLSNAFRYTDSGREVCCVLKESEDKNYVTIVIKDSGKGIGENEMKNLFKRFYSSSTSGKTEDSGIGIGLNLTKSLVDLLGGNITVKSELGKGTEFLVELPVSEELIDATSLNKDETNLAYSMESGRDDIYVVEEERIQQFLKSHEPFTILVADDNDDFRKILVDSLRDNFKVLEVADGKNALKTVMTTHVDLIISDVMMPKLNGWELCQSIKSNLSISHVPVIIITAKTGDENRLEGYQVGADSYIEKPLNMRLLKVRIVSLLMQREKLKQAFSTGLNLVPDKIAITPIDEQFIEKAKRLVEKNLSNTEFSVKDLSKGLNASNSMLYRKMKNVLGLNPNEFIRSIRLGNAAKMLENSSFTISEVAFNCGFNDLSYFGSCFKKKYGATPSEYQNGQKQF
ncbi:hybrid sensor histidine kinase/response regulator transcription factor [Mariniphaga anaerophila]|uniref:hybrid sensor histidine kinase/response regulator transcription factor n=1 Tax=Mariniphaga anaerophila TaxID=1484053 RepID=UPI0015870AD4|nr:hybrid sensor histidine kinase/response regulator transcription factor [Mariniphaga anaerophila]